MPFSLAIDAWSTSDVTPEEVGSDAPPLLRPAPLVKGDTIGVVAPSYAPREGWLHRGVKALERAGYGVMLDSEIGTMRRFERMEDERRAENFMGMWLDPRVKAVIGGTGGYGATRMIPHLEPEVFRRNPKAFVGYSDITALHVAIRQRTGLATFYGYGLLGMGDPETSDFTRDRWTAVLGGATTGAVPADPDDAYVRAIRGGRATAPIVGGCLWLLMQTMGTPWEVELDGCILFFEDVDLPTWHLDGFLVQLLVISASTVPRLRELPEAA